jgi:UDP-N-acetylmuramoyl-tripeptide--D-alanyl-D-alanine ligase
MGWAAKVRLLMEFRQLAVQSLSWRANGAAATLVSICRATLGSRAKLIAITGSFGKTTTTRAVAAILGQSKRRALVPNSFARMYFQAFQQMSRRSIGVLEIGIGQPNQMRGYARAIRPDIAVVTTVGWEHEKYIPGGLEGIRAEKSELVNALPMSGVAVLNRDDENVMWMAQRTNARVVTFGRHSNADVALVGVSPEVTRTRLRLRVAGTEHSLQTSLIGSVSAMSITAALAAAYAAGINMSQAVRALQDLTPTPRRLEPISLSSGATAILDDWKGTPPTAFAAFDTVAELPCERRMAVLGKIPLTTPEPTKPIYLELGRRAAQVFDRVVFIHLSDEAYESYARGAIDGGMAAKHTTRAQNVTEAAHALKQELKAKDILLLKGHSTDHLARIALLL